MNQRFFILIAGVIAAASGTIGVAALMAPDVAGMPVAGIGLLAVALALLVAQRRRRR